MYISGAVTFTRVNVMTVAREMQMGYLTSEMRDRGARVVPAEPRYFTRTRYTHD